MGEAMKLLFFILGMSMCFAGGFMLGNVPGLKLAECTLINLLLIIGGGFCSLSGALKQ